MSYQDDSQQIRRMLEDRIEAVLDEIAPGWVQRRNIAYLTPKNAKELGSFTVQLRDGKMPRGSWYRFSQAIGGGSVELVAYQLYGAKDRYKEAFAWARDFLGLERHEDTQEHKEEREARRVAEEVERARRRAVEDEQAARKREKRVQTALEVWNESISLKGSQGDAYFQARGLPPVSEWPWDPCDTIRFHPRHEYELDFNAGAFPTIIARVDDCFGSLAAVWRIYLDRKKAAKAPVDNAKVGLGPAAGGAVRIGGENAKIGIGEGLETCLAAWVLEGFRYPVWAGLSTSGVGAFEPPVFVEQVNIFPDGDAGVVEKMSRRILEPPGIKAARDLRERLDPTGIKTLINEMCLNGDCLDLLQTLRDYEDHRT